MASVSADMGRLLDVVRSVVVDVSDGRGFGRLSPGVSFVRELGLGSLERVELAVRAGDAFGVRPSEAALATVDTPLQLLEHLRGRVAGERRGAGHVVPPPARGSGAASLPDRAPAPEPVHVTTLVDTLEYHVRHQPDRVHVVLLSDDERECSVTYRQLHWAASSVARRLRARGLRPGGCVALMLPTGLGYFASFLGTLMAGGIPVPLYPPRHLDRIPEYITHCARILEDAQAQILVTFGRAARAAKASRDRVSCIESVLSLDEEQLLQPEDSIDVPLRSRLGPSDTALIQYTSGSTGDPKGVQLTHASVIENIRSVCRGCELGPDDVVVSWLPLYHDMGLMGGWLMNFYYGTPTVLMSPMAFLSRPERWLQALGEYRATCTLAPNFALDLCHERVPDEVLSQLDLHRVRALLNGSEPIIPSTLERFTERFGRCGLRREAIFCAYGLAENTAAVTFPPLSRGPVIERIARDIFEAEGRAVPTGDVDEALEFVGVGFAVSNNEIRIVDAEDRPVAERTQGSIQFRGPSAFRGYYRCPGTTMAVKREDGWVDTGDLGYLADGELFVTGRANDVIIKGGRNYQPHEIEAEVASVAGVRRGRVVSFAVPHERSGTRQIVVVAETREQDPLAREMLEGRVAERVTARVGVTPDRVVLVNPGTVPKTSSGKIRREEAKRRYLEGAIERSRALSPRGGAGVARAGVLGRTRALVREVGRTLYGLYASGVLLSVCLGSMIFGRLIPRGRLSRKAAALESRLGMRMVGLRPRVSGLSKIPEGGAILCANHAGHLDFLICSACLTDDLCYVIKSEVADNPLAAPTLRRMEHVFIDRQSVAKSLSALDEVTGLVQRGNRVMIFPEGTFYPDVGMRPFRLGAFRIAAETRRPVVPVAIRGSRRAMRDGTWMPRRVPIEVEVLEPIWPKSTEIDDIVRMRDRCAEAIGAHIDEPRLYAADIRIAGSE